MKLKSILLTLLVFCFVSSMAQQSILLVSGKRIYVQDTKIDNSGLVLYKTFKGKIKAYEVDEVFSMIRKDSVEVIFYKPECEDVCFKVNQMRDYLHGLADGREVKMWGPMTGNFVLSAAAGASPASPTFSVIVPVLFSGGVGLVNPKIENLDIPLKYQENDHYIEGYRSSVKKKRIITSIIGGGAGLVVGIAARALLFN